MRWPRYGALLAVVCALWAGASAADEVPGVARVRLSVDEPPRVEGVAEVRAGGVLRLRAVVPGRLEVKVGGEVEAECHLGWGEDERLRVDEVEEETPSPLPRVVSREPGREEVEVALPEEVEGGEAWVEVRYAWGWRHEGKPPLERRWRLVVGEEQARRQALVKAFEEEFPLEEAPARAEPEGEQTGEEPEWFEALGSPQVVAHQPEVLRVPAQASRAQVAEQLFGEAGAVGAFDEEACEGPEDGGSLLRACVRVRQVEALRPELRARVRRALEAQLEREEAWLRGWEPTQTVALAERGLVWAQRAEVRDEQGRGYFDRYLGLLEGRRVEVEGKREWDFLGEDSEQLKKAVALRARQWETGYRVTDGVPELKPGDVVGRCYFTLGLPARRASVAVRVLRPLVEERTQERALVRLRNGPWRGPRALVPGEDGLWRGYAVEGVNLTGVEPLEDAGTRLYGYYPGTRFIRPGEWRPGVEGRGGGQEGLRRALLEQALAAATAEEPEALLGLDHEVLGLLTAGQRQGLLETVLGGPALTSALAQEAVELLARVVASTPAEDFAALERTLMHPKVLRRLLRLEGPQQALLGQAFTLQALASAPLPLDPLEALPGVELGRQGEESHLLNVVVERTGSGDTLLRLGPVRQRFEARYLSSTEEQPLSRGLRAREWVRVELHGPTPQTRLMTALELALRASEADSGLVWAAVGRLGELHLLYGGVSALARAPLGAGAAVEGRAAEAARRAAVRSFSGRVALVGVLALVDSHREELERTQAGRNFLAVHDVALLGLAARDVSRLATSGLPREWARQGGLVLGLMGEKASAGLRESVESARALARAVEKVLAEGKVVATGEGLTFNTPEGAGALRHAWFSVRGDMAAERALGSLQRAGVATPEVERTLSALRSLGERSEAWARAWSAVARRAAALPAPEARQYLEAVESLRAQAQPAARAAVAELLRGSGTLTHRAPGLFLEEAGWLVRRPGLEEEALTALARKAVRGTLNLRWLGTTGLTAEELNFLGRDAMTPWKTLQEAAEAPGNLKLQLRARTALRGLAGEMVTERSAHRLFPGHKVSGRQVHMQDGHILDFELEAADGTIRRALEVKGWTADTWRRALKAWTLESAGARLEPRQEQLLRQLKRLVEQLEDAATSPRGKPFLVCTDELSQKTQRELQRFLSRNSVAVDIESMREVEMIATTKRLRAAFNMPEKLPGAGTEGAP
ncbi:hypothetical protein [Archangium violaceum]|uniref:Uncharacterized protein n=1 Tax=Archangium violaceum Cb vi76 TaxID=1406225 RepID=A0A084SKK4_9BACT|nr:hypothetical protein [Archangium violaceum]KFA88989.1 hypothetical protein Q664_37625 [Archangium violaceum Cb vi76]